MADIRNERRSNKLKKYFGQAPPPDLINNKSDQMENRHRRSIISLTLLMSKENGIINLFNMINDIEKREEFFDCVDGNAKEYEEGSKYGDHLTVPKKLEKRDLTNLAIEEVAHDSEYELGNFPTNNTVYMNENIVIKVNDTTVKNENYKNNIKSENEGKNEEKEKNDDESDEIFYNTNSELLLDRKESSIEDQNERIYEIYENSNIEYLVEKNVFSTLEESINEDITDPETKEGFKKQLSYLRESFIKNSNNIRRMSQMNTSLSKPTSENIWKGSNLLKPMIDNEIIVNKDYTDENIKDL